MSQSTQHLSLAGLQLQLLAERAVYIQPLECLLVSDVHLGKSETFQARGIPIPNLVNQASLDRLHRLCVTYKAKRLFILGDLFHSKFALVDEVVEGWSAFLSQLNTQVTLIIGNHDRRLIQQLQALHIHCLPDALRIDNLVLSHEPQPQPGCLNICGHVHPCVRLKTKLDTLRLPCFYLDQSQNLLILPSFGEFTGGYEMPLKPDAIAYVLVEDSVVSLAG